ncbi:hypothetical protein D8Y22_10105 [Salinadaptatus halalkaliphilus]|uniref:Uncharacterized protein n=1 Tax=Salinadaptatus halalkaliphilus TaxID=2419781 RepID=A0A4S3TLK4_9EURY|nr:hypothetical protein [Salinadaptatus halalkaliphilus]THE64956.1 hypothetical protein D8Y22_10105 [Salinadaptatus halalkaliphilus]
MHRRSLLAALGASGAVLSGCLTSHGPDDGSDGGETNDTGSDDGPNGDGSDSRSTTTGYEACTAGPEVVPVSNLPPAAETEATTAIETDAYETDGDLILESLVDLESYHLIQGGSYYEATVERDDGETRLVLEPSLPTASHLEVENATDESVSLGVRVELGGETLLDREVSLDPGEERPLADADYRYGSYRADLETDKQAETLEWRVNESIWQPVIVVTPEEIRLRQDVAEIVYCDWDDEGRLKPV